MKLLPRFLKMLPFLSILVIILAGSSLSFRGHPFLPTLFLIPVFYWLVFNPAWLPLWSLFGIGLFYDALMGYELCFSSLLLMLSDFAARYARSFLSSHHFILIWGAFSLYSLGYLSLYGIVTLGNFPPLVSWIYGIILYPLVTWLLSHLYVRVQPHG